MASTGKIRPELLLFLLLVLCTSFSGCMEGQAPGRSILQSPTDRKITPVPFSPCVDSDVNDQYPDGLNFFESGMVTHNGQSWSDECNAADPGLLKEYYCLNGSKQFIEIQCNTLGPNYCKQGACVPVQLKSNYFSNDENAIQIASGLITNYHFSDLYLGIFHHMDVDVNRFEYKILSALRMLGYSLSPTQNKRLLPRWAESFQITHGQAITNTITREFILALDEELFTKENENRAYIESFPIDETFTFNQTLVQYVPNHANEPPKDHARYFYSRLLSALPQPISPFTLRSVYYFFAYQGHGIIYYEPDGTRKLNYIPSAAPLNRQNTGSYKASRSQNPDYYDGGTFFHEYGHQIDSLLYGYFSPDSGMVNTHEFYALLFDMDDCSMGPFNKTCRPLANAKFVSDYALSWENPNHPGHYSIAESFAESFAMYVVNGRLYRELTALDESFALQYAWLKTNVFNGLEYCTGSNALVSWNSPYWDYAANFPPSNVHDTLIAHVSTQITDPQPVFSLDDLTRQCA